MKYTTKIALLLIISSMMVACNNQVKVTNNEDNLGENQNTEIVDKVSTTTKNEEVSDIENNSEKSAISEYTGKVDNTEEIAHTKKEIKTLTKTIADIKTQNQEVISKNEVIRKEEIKNEVVKKVEPVKEVIVKPKPIKALGIQTIGPVDFSKSYTGGKSILIDVRTPREFSEGHLPGAINIDYWGGEFKSKVAALDKTKAYAIYCKSGGRSYRAAKAMTKGGLPTVYNLDGGINAWKSKSMPIE